MDKPNYKAEELSYRGDTSDFDVPATDEVLDENSILHEVLGEEGPGHTVELDPLSDTDPEATEIQVLLRGINEVWGSSVTQRKPDTSTTVEEKTRKALEDKQDVILSQLASEVPDLIGEYETKQKAKRAAARKRKKEAKTTQLQEPLQDEPSYLYDVSGAARREAIRPAKTPVRDQTSLPPRYPERSFKVDEKAEAQVLGPDSKPIKTKLRAKLRQIKDGLRGPEET